MQKVFRIEKTMGVRREFTAQATARGRLAPHVVPASPETTPGNAALAALRATLDDQRRELSALAGHGSERPLLSASAALGAAVDGMEKGVHAILRAVESIDDDVRALGAMARSDYERGLAQDIQDKVVRVYEACNFQDLAGQQIAAAIATLSATDDCLARLARAGGGIMTAAPSQADDSLLNGPKLDGASGHVSQDDIDAILSQTG